MNTQIVVQAIQNGLRQAIVKGATWETLAFVEGLIVACEVNFGQPIIPLKSVWDDARQIKDKILEQLRIIQEEEIAQLPSFVPMFPSDTCIRVEDFGGRVPMSASELKQAKDGTP